MEGKKYSRLSYNINNYEILKENEFSSPMCESIYVTDNTGLTASTWDVKYYDKKFKDPFLACYDIRFHPFDYVNTDIVMRYDGSMKCIGNTDEIIKVFNEGNYDICLCHHPERDNMYDEYIVWCNFRGYSPQQANNVLSFMNNYEGYDVKNYKGLYQGNFVIQRNNKVNNDLNDMVYAILKYLAPENAEIERLDQTITTFVINKYFHKKLKVLNVDNRIAYSKYFQWYQHNSNIKFTNAGSLVQGYLFGEPVDTNTIQYL